jgi:hypothetical protein
LLLLLPNFCGATIAVEQEAVELDVEADDGKVEVATATRSPGEAAIAITCGAKPQSLRCEKPCQSFALPCETQMAPSPQNPNSGPSWLFST